jgi:hypothetical protein
MDRARKPGFGSALWGLLAAGLLLGGLGGAAPAGAEALEGHAIAVAKDVERGELRLHRGTVLRVDADTRITDADGGVVSLADLDVSEGRSELPVRWEGRREGGAIRAVSIAVGAAAD